MRCVRKSERDQMSEKREDADRALASCHGSRQDTPSRSAVLSSVTLSHLVREHTGNHRPVADTCRAALWRNASATVGCLKAQSMRRQALERSPTSCPDQRKERPRVTAYEVDRGGESRTARSDIIALREDDE